MPPARRFFPRLFFIYILDWTVILGTIILVGSSSLWAKPIVQPFHPNDPSISYPYELDAKIPTSLLIVLAVVVPALTTLFFTLALPSRSQSYTRSFVTVKGWRRRLYSLNSAWLGLGLSIAIAMLVTNLLKNLTGRPRPDMLDRCDIDEDKIKESTVGPGRLVTWDVCSSRKTLAGDTVISGGVLDEGNLRDGFRSFPSGHASLSFAGLTYLAIFLAEFVFALPLATVTVRYATSSPIANRRPRSSHTAHKTEERDVARGTGDGDDETPLPRFPIMGAIVICGIPLLTAAYIATTRLSDNRHHPVDVLFGALLGIFAGVGGWRWYGAWSCAGGEGRVYGLVGVAQGRSWKVGRGRKRIVGGEQKVHTPPPTV